MQTRKKLNLGPLPSQTDDYSAYEETLVRWDRIIVSAIALILLVSIILYFGFFSNGETTEESTAPSQLTLLKQAPNNEEKTNLTSTDEKDALSVASERSIKVPELPRAPSLITPEINREDLSAVVNQGQVNQEPVKLEPVKHPPQKREIKTQTFSEKTSSSTAKGLDKRDQRLTEENQTGSNPAPVIIVNSAISKAVLTLTLNGKTPGPDLAKTLMLGDRDIVKVILHTHMEGIRGKTLYHEWYRDGVKQARVKIPVNLTQQKSYSSKYINRQMLGKWHVKVIDESAEPYVLADFEVAL